MSEPALDADVLFTHGAFVRRVAVAALGGDDEVEDVIQDTWLAALQRTPRRPGAVKAWLAGITRRQAAQRIRSRVRERRRVTRTAARLARRGGSEDAAALTQRIETGRRLVAAVLTLPDYYREAIVLRYYDDLPPREVAARLEIPVETVRTRTRRGLDLLRARLSETHGGGRRGLHAALLPLVPGPSIAAPAVPALAVGAGVVSKKLLLAIAMLALITTGLLVVEPWQFLPSEETEEQNVSQVASGPGPKAPDPRLAGRAEDAGPEPAGFDADKPWETRDFLTLAQRVVHFRQCRNALAAWGKEDAAIMRRVVDWLHPRHDVHRRVQRDGQVAPSDWADIWAMHCVLEGIGPACVEILVATLSDPDPMMQSRVVIALGGLGGDGAAAVAALIGHAEACEGWIVPHVLAALGKMGPAAREAVPLFTAYLRDGEKDDDARAMAAAGLLLITEPTPDVLETCAIALRDGSYEVCCKLLPTIAALREAGAPLAPELRGLVVDPEVHDWIRAHAMDALSCVGAADEKTGPVLLAVALDDDSSEELRRAAVEAVARFGGTALEGLYAGVSDLGGADRLLVASALTREGISDAVEAKRVLAILEPLREAEDVAQRRTAIQIAGNLVHRGFGLNWVARWRSDPSPEIRKTALHELHFTRDKSGTAITAGFAALKDEDAEVRREALYLIRKRLMYQGQEGKVELSGERATAALCALEDPDPRVRSAASPLVRQYVPHARENLLGVWIELLGSDDGMIVWNAAGAIRRMGAEAREARPALRAAYGRTSNASLRRVLQSALDALGEK